ncbi:MAG: hypothetical protein E7K04_01540 [Helicobacter sp.]|nr:hypothetical protein [Helicobacter sp.]
MRFKKSVFLALFIMLFANYAFSKVYYIEERYRTRKTPVFAVQKNAEDDGSGAFLGPEASGIRTFFTRKSGEKESVLSPFMAVHGGIQFPFGSFGALRVGVFLGGILHNTLWLGVDSKFLFRNNYYGGDYLTYIGLGGGIAGILPIAEVGYYGSLSFGKEFGRHLILPIFKYYFGINTFSIGAEYTFRF